MPKVTPEIIVRPEAEAEMSEAFRWYEEKVPGLGSDFLLSIDAAFRSLARDPEQYPVVYKNLRRVLIRCFPYQILFMQEEGQVIIIAVFHPKRNPSRWKKRTYNK